MNKREEENFEILLTLFCMKWKWLAKKFDTLSQMISCFKNFVLYRVLWSSRKIVLPLEIWLTAQLYSWFSIKLSWNIANCHINCFFWQNFELHTLVYWSGSFEEYSSQSIQIISGHNYDIYIWIPAHWMFKFESLFLDDDILWWLSSYKAW
jgi:hypothetical protein